MSAAEAFTIVGDAELALTHAHQALAVCRTTRPTRLTDALQHAHTQMREAWPTHATVRDLADGIRSLTGVR